MTHHDTIGAVADTGELADLLRDWSDFYVITFSGNLYHAERRDNGARVHETAAGRLRREIEQDYRACPVRVPDQVPLPRHVSR